MKVIFSAILVLFSLISYSQSYYTISGKVTGSDGQPLQGASVFAQNTTMGSATDASGNYKLWLPPGGYDVVVSFTGFSNETHRVSSSDNGKEFNFTLRPKERELADVSIVASSEVRNGWVKHGAFFIEQFIGRTMNSRDCYLRNPEVLKFYFYRRTNKLKVTATEPLLIENRAMGYNIRYDLDSFTYDYASKVSLYTGAPLFEQMVPADTLEKQRWDIARKQAYYGSILHFMRSVYNKSLKEEGFEVQYLVSKDGKDLSMPLQDYYNFMKYQFTDSTQTVQINPFQKNVGVIYSKEKPENNFVLLFENEPEEFQFSLIDFQPGEPIVIEQNGYYYEQADLTFNAYWTWEKVADILPYDFDPLKN